MHTSPGTYAAVTRSRQSARMRGAPNRGKRRETRAGAGAPRDRARHSPSNFTAFRFVLPRVVHNLRHLSRRIRSPSPVKTTARRVVSRRGYPQPVRDRIFIRRSADAWLDESSGKPGGLVRAASAARSPFRCTAFRVAGATGCPHPFDDASPHRHARPDDVIRQSTG